MENHLSEIYKKEMDSTVKPAKKSITQVSDSLYAYILDHSKTELPLLAALRKGRRIYIAFRS
jgi:hypothetical protein